MFAGKSVFDKELKVYFYPLSLYFVSEFEEERLFLNPMNILSMDEYDLKSQADKIMDASRRTAEPIRNLELTRFEIVMMYIIEGIRAQDHESFIDLINGFIDIFEETFGSQFDFSMTDFQFKSLNKVVVTKSLGETIQNQLEDFLIINEDNFEKVCDSIKEVNGWNMGANENKPEYNPANEKARRIAEQLNRSRKKIQELKSKAVKDEVTLTSFISSYCTQTKTNPNEVFGTYTLYQFFMQSARESLYFEYNTNIQAMLHGASDVKLKN